MQVFLLGLLAAKLELDDLVRQVGSAVVIEQDADTVFVYLCCPVKSV